MKHKFFILLTHIAIIGVIGIVGLMYLEYAAGPYVLFSNDGPIGQLFGEQASMADAVFSSRVIAFIGFVFLISALLTSEYETPN